MKPEMMNRTVLRVAATAMLLAYATAANAQLADALSAPGATPKAEQPLEAWMPLLVVFGLVALVGAVLLMTTRRMRGLPWETEETQASTARGREKKLSEELRALWNKTTTTETLRPRD